MAKLPRFLRQVIADNGESVFLEFFEQTVWFRHDARQHDLLALPRSDRLLPEFGDQFLYQSRVLRLVHEEARLDYRVSLYGVDGLRIVGCDVTKVAHGAPVLVVDFDAVLDGFIAELRIQYFFKLAPDQVILCREKIVGCRNPPVLRMREGDGRRFSLPNLADTSQCVARHAEQNGVKVIVRP